MLTSACSLNELRPLLLSRVLQNTVNFEFSYVSWQQEIWVLANMQTMILESRKDGMISQEQFKVQIP
jgi:hypothetical protein